MNHEAQRIAIAEACGWTDCHLQHENGRTFEFDCTGTPPNWSGCRYRQIPDYLNDLNAMHEAEKVLTEAQRTVYWNWLIAVCARTPETHFSCATAAQRAEAFLRTIGKWVERDEKETTL